MPSDTKFDERLVDVGRGYAVETLGLRLLRPLTEIEWCELGRELRDRLSGYQWAIGDWLALGSVFGPHGEKYNRAADLTGIPIERLQSYYYVSRTYSRARRVAGATWSMHKEAVTIRDDLRLPFLQRAVASGWGMKAFVHEVSLQPKEHPNISGNVSAAARTRPVRSPIVRVSARCDQEIEITWKYPDGSTAIELATAPAGARRMA